MRLPVSIFFLSLRFRPCSRYSPRHRILFSSVSQKIHPLCKFIYHQIQQPHLRLFCILIHPCHYQLPHGSSFQSTRWLGVPIRNPHNSTTCLSAFLLKESCHFGYLSPSCQLLIGVNGEALALCILIGRISGWRDAAPRRRLFWVR